MAGSGARERRHDTCKKKGIKRGAGSNSDEDDAGARARLLRRGQVPRSCDSAGRCSHATCRLLLYYLLLRTVLNLSHPDGHPFHGWIRVRSIKLPVGVRNHKSNGLVVFGTKVIDFDLFLKYCLVGGANSAMSDLHVLILGSERRN